MQPAGSAKHPYEIWVMTQTSNSNNQKTSSKPKVKIISAWKYPGVSPINAPPPIPAEVWEELGISGK